jgi:hypothetical protein
MFLDLLELLLATPLPEESRPSVSDWSRLSQRLGTELPTDYRELITTLGSGCVNRFLDVVSPFTSFQNLEYAVSRSRAIHAGIIEVTGVDDITFPIFPQPGGLLPWGWSWNDDTFHWITNYGDPNSWPVFVEGRYGERGSISSYHDRVPRGMLARRHRTSGYLPGRSTGCTCGIRYSGRTCGILSPTLASAIR